MTPITLRYVKIGPLEQMYANFRKGKYAHIHLWKKFHQQNIDCYVPISVYENIDYFGITNYFNKENKGTWEV